MKIYKLFLLLLSVPVITIAQRKDSSEKAISKFTLFALQKIQKRVQS
ncbi:MULTISPECIES: hypothetical protein [Niastella]|nr:hypothetical protein [Niastella soli]